MLRARIRVDFQGQSDIFSECHGTPQGSTLIHDPTSADDLFTYLLIRGPEIYVIIQHLTFAGTLQPDEDSHHGTFTAAAAAHDNEDIPMVNGEI